jgi:hypothetical protein
MAGSSHIDNRREVRAAWFEAARSPVAVILCVLAMWPLSAGAHHRTNAGASNGVAIANLTHGQMAVIADYRSAILDLAERRSRIDPIFRRLKNYEAIQYTYCLWGLMPGSLTDEQSPFNECTHAYLAATRALLLHLLIGSVDMAPVEELARRIEADMLRSQTSLTLCRYSGEDFNTASVIAPHWGEALSHAPTLVTLIGLALAAVCGAQFLWRRSQPALPRRSGRIPHP